MCNMTDPNFDPTTSKESKAADAAKALARLMEQDFGHIDPIALKLFIQLKWHRVSTLAHTIHEGI